MVNSDWEDAAVDEGDGGHGAIIAEWRHATVKSTAASVDQRRMWRRREDPVG